MHSFYIPYEQHLLTLHRKSQYRKLAFLSQEDKKGYLDFSSNDYLNLSHHPEILHAGIQAAREYGVGSTGSRLLSGNTLLSETFEQQIAQDKKTEAALIFNTGFQANLSVLSALIDSKVLGGKPIVFFDKSNHSSLYQAVFLGSSELVRYKHNDVQHLEYLLDGYKNDPRPKFIVTETVFGMEGDIIDLEKIVSLARQHQALLYLDEAHAMGLLGPDGYGLSTMSDLTDLPCVIMGTFSKALGSSGGYVACSQTVKEYLMNKATGFIYSTAPSAMVIGAAFKAWQIVKTQKNVRKCLFSLSDYLRSKLVCAGFDIGNSLTPIIPIILKQEKLTLYLQEKLLERKIIVSAIRPPTVSPNSARLRVGLTACHHEQDLEKLLKSLERP